MDVTAALLRAAASRPHVLLAELPGGTAVRLAAERDMRRRAFPVASTPADADVLLVAGPRCPDMDAPIERLWQGMPAPRALARAETAEALPAALDSAVVRLRDLEAQRAMVGHAADGTSVSSGSDDDGAHGHGESDGDAPQEEAGSHHGHRPGAADHQGRDGHGGHQADNGDGQHGGHRGHAGGGMDMPAGLPMAEQGEDRDGLTLDRLHLPLGPLLNDWPAGLMVRTIVQGDVIQEAAVAVLRPAAPGPSFWLLPWERAAGGETVPTGMAARWRAAARLDSLGRLLAVAGWPAAATMARRLRDDLLDGAPEAAVRPRIERLVRRVGRSRTLYWLTRGMGRLSAGDAAAAGVSGPAGRADGDVPARYRVWLSAVSEDLGRLEESAPLDPSREEGPRGPWDPSRPASAAVVEMLPRLLEGTELAAARLIVASLDPDLGELAGRPVEVAGG